MDKVTSRLLQTGQTTSYETGDDGDLEKGMPRAYGVLTTGQHSGTTNIVINGKTHALSNEAVWDNRTGIMWARYVPTADIGPATDGKLFWEQWTLENKTDISFNAVVGADVLGGNGDCTTDFFDTVQAGWAHDAGNGEYDCDGSQVSWAYLNEAGVLSDTVTYKITYTVKNYSAGSIRTHANNVTGTDRSANGTYTEFLTSDGTVFRLRGDNNFIGSVDDITVEPVTAGEILSAAAEFDTGACPIGRKITISGSTSNNETVTVSISTAAKLTVSETTIVDEAAGDTVSVVTVDDLIWDFKDQANANSLGGYSDWRIPNILELISLVNYQNYNPCIDTTTFPSTPTDYAWSSTFTPGSGNYAMTVQFIVGRIYEQIKKPIKKHCRLCRGGV